MGLIARTLTGSNYQDPHTLSSESDPQIQIQIQIQIQNYQDPHTYIQNQIHKLFTSPHTDLAHRSHLQILNNYHFSPEISLGPTPHSIWIATEIKC